MIKLSGGCTVLVMKTTLPYDLSSFIRSALCLLRSFKKSVAVQAMLQEVISGVEDYTFEIEDALDKQLGARPLPFTGMDKNKAPLCEQFIVGGCVRGAHCPYRHARAGQSTVCKHWLRHLCKKGDDCEFLHEYDMSKMPPCYFFQKFGECNNRDCQYLHVDAETLKVKDCAWYDRGFCKHGPHCRNRHTRRVLCQNYLCGFCPEGPKCKFIHAKFELPVTTQTASATQQPFPGVFNAKQTRRPLDQVTCFKCGEKGHYANMCPQSFRAMQMGLIGSQAQHAANVGVK